ncbi:MAG TPA: OmpH family outer membrane protein [Nitrospira sp.]|nr:OmpH family outer membrane protein [Nitrospira sp.]
MKRAGMMVAVGGALLACWMGSVQASDAIRIAVMDQQAVIERSKAGKAALEEVKAYQATRQKIINADEQELKELEQAIQDPNSKLSEGAKQEKQEQFRTKVEAYQRRLQDFNREVQQKQRDMAAEYSKKIADAAQAVAQKEGFVAVLDKGNESMFRIVLYNQPALDVTDLVVKEFDRQQN